MTRVGQLGTVESNKKSKRRKCDLGPSKAAAQRQVRTDEPSTARMVTLMEMQIVEEDDQIHPYKQHNL